MIGSSLGAGLGQFIGSFIGSFFGPAACGALGAAGCLLGNLIGGYFASKTSRKIWGGTHVKVEEQVPITEKDKREKYFEAC